MSGDSQRGQAITAGFITAIVGFVGAFPIVLAGSRAAGATEAQAASGLLAVSVLMGLCAIGLSARLRLPVSIAWTTPGSALLISGGAVAGGYPAAVGAFLLSGVLLALCGLSATLERAIRAIPAPIAAAVLAGVLLPICLEPARGVAAEPLTSGLLVFVWLVLLRFARRWAVVGMLAVAVLIVLVDHPGGVDAAGLSPRLVLVAPELHAGTLLGLGIPLFIVTMASQNIPGLAVLASFGHHPPLRPVLLATGGATVVGAPAGVVGINLAAITQALAAGPDAGPDPARRWPAGISNGIGVIVLGLGAGVAATLVAAAPDGLIATAVGLALFAPLANAIGAATRDDALREPAAVTLLVAASGIDVAGVSAPFWGLVAGLGFLAVQRLRR